ncbi:MAG: hypothetical protein ACO26C_08530, partial [Ilumatobacteraceae bacterium]
MDILVALGQGAGLAVACGLAALLPLGVLAVAVLLGWTPGALALADGTPILVGAWVAGLIEAALRAVLPLPVRIALSAVGAAAAFELAAGDQVPLVGLIAGAAIGAGTAWTSTRMADRAVQGGGTPWGVAAILGVAAIAVAALAIVPFVGFALVLGAAYGALRARK